ncbi:hypothetical protein GCM10008905_26490 [Clostridium malenominatum]|uniref:Uncharacterized protein n=1 Tax=Clostridium malenominatum TaxID=1539 RepID=A0ABP3UDC0_9CLOT
MKTSYLTKGGILSALGVIFIYLSTIAPTNKLFLLVISSALIPLGVIGTNIKVALGIYTSTSLLGLFIIGFKGSVFLYIIFFGIYGIIKLYIEKIGTLHLELIAKFVFFNLCLYIAYLAIYLVLPNFDLNKLPLPLPIILILLEVSFFLYDYALTLFIHKAAKFFRKNS